MKSNKSSKENTGIRAAIAAAGSTYALAELCSVSQPAVMKWLKTFCPAERAVDIEKVTGVWRGAIRPDLFEEKK